MRYRLEEMNDATQVRMHAVTIYWLMNWPLGGVSLAHKRLNEEFCGTVRGTHLYTERLVLHLIVKSVRRTIGPLATYAKPIFSPTTRQWSNFSGGTNSSTFRCRLLGRRYCPSVTISTPIILKSRKVASTSSSFSPTPYYF